MIPAKENSLELSRVSGGSVGRVKINGHREPCLFIV